LKLGDSGKASSYYKEEVTLRGEIGGKLAGEIEFRRESAGLEEKLGDLYVELGDPRAAKDHYDGALETRLEIARENPGHDQAGRDVLLSYNKLGTFYLLHQKDPARARDFSQKALDGFKQRLLTEPENVVAKQDLGATHYFVATTVLRAGDRKAADLHYKEYLKICEGLVDDPKAKLNVRDLMIARARCGEHKLASITAMELIEAPQRDVDVRAYYSAACAFSLCAGAVAEEPASSETKALARSYTESAFKSLRLAIGAGWKSVVDVETDPDLDAIRNAPGFDDVVAELRKAAGR
jgi:tetratricopeptide (TPR) repeat protein